MFYAIYKITNKIDGKIYIGSHKTNNLEDSYMGSGKYLKRAIEKYGICNFNKEILFVFDNPESMYQKEAELVNEDFLATQNTYNLKVGGFGGWDYVNASGLNGFKDVDLARNARNLANDAIVEKYGENWRSIAQQKRSPEDRKQSAIKAVETKNQNGYEYETKQMNTQSAIDKKISTFSKIRHQVGEKNSQHGTMWITNGIESRKIHKTDSIPSGWSPGRKIK